MIESPDPGNLDQVREATRGLIEQGFEAEEPVLIEAPPGSGKSTKAIQLAAEIDTPVTYLARRIDLYEQAERIAQDHGGIRTERIPAPHRNCDTFKGKTDGSPSALKRLYSKGFGGREIHLRFNSLAPCGKECPYFQRLSTINQELDSIDLLIGNHSHSRRQDYVRDRFVVLDEFNSDPFLRTFPNEESDAVDDPGIIIPAFLRSVAEYDEAFPANAYQDVTDLITNRGHPSEWWAAIDWFREHGASRRKAQRFEFMDATAKREDPVHALAPYLTLSLLCMETVGPGIEIAPPPDGSLDQLWNDADLAPQEKCVRDRNTGEMFALQPADLSSAAQIIGLDGTPTIELWNLLFAPESGFDHRQVIDREDFSTYLRSAMNMSFYQIGGGMHPYAGGNISRRDGKRLAFVYARENGRFSLITTRKILQRYKNRGWLERFVKRVDEDTQTEAESSKLYAEYRARHYATIKSSNEFEEEAIGAVMGNPFPDDRLVAIWAGFCGKAIDPPVESGEEKTFGEFGDRIYRHFAHNAVAQAALRFGRDDEVIENGGANVYISTFALPDWFEVDQQFELQTGKSVSAAAGKLYECWLASESEVDAFHTVNEIHDEISADDWPEKLRKRSLRDGLDDLVSKDYIAFKEKTGENGADIYRWDGDGEVICSDDVGELLIADGDVFLLEGANDA